MDASSPETQVTLAIVMPYLLQWLKGKAGFPLMNYNSETLNRWISGAVAILTSLGIQMSFNVGAGTLIITGLTASGIASGIQHAAFQWAGQHLVYKAVIAPALPGAVQATKRAEPDATIIEPMVGEKGPPKDAPTEGK